MYLPIILIFILQNLHSSLNCQTDISHPTVENIISLLKEKTEKIQSVWLEYTSFVDRNNDVEHFEASFIMQGRDYVHIYAKHLERKKKVQIYPEEISKIEKPNNLLELLIIKLNRPKNIPDSLSNVDTVLVKNYYLNGQFHNRVLLPNENIIRDIYKFPDGGDELTIYGDPRILLGFYPYTRKDENPYALYEFFEKEGSYYYKEEDGFKILWHETYLKQEHSYKSSCEVWFNEENNLVKVKEIIYLARSYPHNIETIEKAIKGKVSCDFPQSVIMEISFSDFHPVWKIPLQMEITTYGLDCTRVLDSDELFIDYESGKITEIEYKARLCLCPKVVNKKITLLVNKNDLKINEPISKELFLPPEPTKVPEINSEENTRVPISHFFYLNPMSIIYICLFLLITVVTIFITRHFLGWKI
ncbi:MAG: hypothetical protein N2169_07580 [bacterium]|nr:hypothetical protein [bacterium]